MESILNYNLLIINEIVNLKSSIQNYFSPTVEANYYKEYYELERKHWWFTARAEILMTQIRNIFGDRTDLKILNVGAATGRSSELLQQFGAVTSVEYDEECFNFTKKNVPIPIIKGSILELPFDDNTFDLVCAFDVIEHVEDDILATMEMRRVCASGGVLFVTVPAFMFLWSEHDVVNHHYRRYTEGGVRRLFESSDEPILTSYFNFWLFFPIATFRLLSKILPKRKPKNADTTTSDFGVLRGGAINTLFYRIFKSENVFLASKMRLPVGVSILSLWRKR